MSIYKNGKLIAGGRQCMPLLSFMWADHILNDASWLRGDTFSWQDGGVYQAAYNHLVADIDGKSLTSETIGSTTVQFYVADDGHKICPVAQESNVASIYAATGVAWYYIIDTTNERFKLPRINPDKAKVLDTAPVSVGVYGDGNALMTRRTSDGATGALTCYAPGNPNNSFYTQGFSAYNGAVGISTDPTNSGLVGSGTMTTNGATTHYSGKKYLYFYVGNFTQTALENTAGLNASLFNAKADIDLSNAAPNASTSAKETINGWLMPDYSAGVTFANNSSYAHNGWLFVEAPQVTSGTVSVSIDNNIVYRKSDYDYANGYHKVSDTSWIPYEKGKTITVSGSFTSLIFYKCKGE